MLKQISVLEVKIGERTYELYCKNDSPLGELHDALLKMKGYVVKRITNAQEEEQQTADFVDGKTDGSPSEEVHELELEEVSEEENSEAEDNQ